MRRRAKSYEVVHYDGHDVEVDYRKVPVAVAVSKHGYEVRVGRDLEMIGIIWHPMVERVSDRRLWVHNFEPNELCNTRAEAVWSLLFNRHGDFFEEQSDV